MHIRDAQNKLVERVMIEATAQIPLRTAIADAAQSGRVEGGAMPTVNPNANNGGLRVLRCDTVPLNEGYLGSEDDD